MRGRAIFERNASACENAKGKTCHCACGGALHGIRHSAAWRKETWRAIVAANDPQTQLSLLQPEPAEAETCNAG